MGFDSTFDCNGKVNSNDWELSRSRVTADDEFGNGSDGLRYLDFGETRVELFGHSLPVSAAIRNLQHLSMCMEMQMKILARHESSKVATLPSSSKNKKSFYEIRKSICDFVNFIKNYLTSLENESEESRMLFIEEDTELDDTFKSLRRFFSRFRSNPDATFHYAASNLGNKCSEPEFHMYHMHLELRWIFLHMVKQRMMHLQFAIDFDDLDPTVQLIVDDLVYVSIKIFERIPVSDLRMKNPYSCTCNRELWVMLQIFLERLSPDVKCSNFWHYVNTSLRKVMRNTTTTTSQNVEKIFWHQQDEKDLPRLENFELFAAWLTYHLGLLHGYDLFGNYVGPNSIRVSSNYEQIERVLTGLAGRGGKDGDPEEFDEELRAIIPMIRVLADDWWPTRVQIISHLWDCFHRRLDQPFLLQATGPWTFSIEKKSPIDILKQVHEKIDGIHDQSKESSYGMFLRFLGSYLPKIYDKNNLRSWNQFKGRVYSKFSKNRVQEYGETGLYNFIMLFLTMAVTADTVNVCKMMLDLLPPIQESNLESARRQRLCWKGQLAVLLVYNEKSLDLTSISDELKKIVNMVSCGKDENARSMMSSFIETFGHLTTSSENLNNGEHCYVDGWIDRYLMECPKNRVGSFMKMLQELLEKCSRLDECNPGLGPGKILDALWSSVAGRIRQLVFEPPITSDNYVDHGKLAVAFTVEALRCPTVAKRHGHTAVSLFQHFTASISVKDPRLSKYFIVAILRNDNVVERLENEMKNFDFIVIQVWIKCCFLGLDDDNDDEMRCLKNRMTIIPEVKKLFASQGEIYEFENSRTSLLIFIKALANHRCTLKTESEQRDLDAKIRSYFNNIDKWTLPTINEKTKDSDVASCIYKCLGTLVRHCSTSFYNKNQSINNLRLLMNKFVIISEQSSQIYLKQLGKSVFGSMILGLENLRPRNDLTLQSVICELFDGYLPILVAENFNGFEINDTLVECFVDSTVDYCCLLFEKLSTTFIIVSGDNTTHKHCYLVMILLRDLLKSNRGLKKHVVEFIVAICVPNIVSCYFKLRDLHPHKQQTINFITDLIANVHYRQDCMLRNKFKETVVSVILKLIVHHPQTGIDFLRSLKQIDGEIVDRALPQIEKIVNDSMNPRMSTITSLRILMKELQCIRKGT